MNPYLEDAPTSKNPYLDEAPEANPYLEDAGNLVPQSLTLTPSFGPSITDRLPQPALPSQSPRELIPGTQTPVPETLTAEKIAEGEAKAAEELHISQVGISPEKIMTGKEITAATGGYLPEAVSIPISAAGKLAAGIGQYATSKQGMAETVLAATPAAPAVLIKWTYDMVHGGVMSAIDIKDALTQKVNDYVNTSMANAAGGNAKMPDRAMAQRVTEDVVNAAAMLAGGAKAGEHTAVKLNEIRKAIFKPEIPVVPTLPKDLQELAPATALEVAKTTEVSNAIPIEKPNEGVLRAEVPQPEVNVGLREVVPRDQPPEVAPAAQAAIGQEPVEVRNKGGAEVKLPELRPGDRAIKIQQPDGTIIDAVTNGKEWEVGDEKIPNVGRAVEINPGEQLWSDGPLRKGETILAGETEPKEVAPPPAQEPSGQTPVVEQKAPVAPTPKTMVGRAKEFKRLVDEHGIDEGWIEDPENYFDPMANAKTGLGAQGFAISRKKADLQKVAYERVAKALGEDRSSTDSQQGRAALLEKLQAYIQKQADEKAAMDAMERGESPPEESTATFEPGPGAKTFSESSKPAAPESYGATSLKNAVADLERAGLGLPEATPTETRNMAERWIASGEEMLRDPGAGQRIADEVIANPQRGMTDSESALLLRHKTSLMNALNRTAEETISGDPQVKAEAQVRYARQSEQFNKLLDAIKERGSEWGREGRWRQAMAYEDYTFATQERLLRASKGGEPLTDTERETLLKTISERNAKIEEIAHNLNQTQRALMDEAVKRATAEANQNPVVEPHVRIIAEKVKDYFDKRADAALKRMSGKLFTISPQVLADLTDLGVSRILGGAARFAEWSIDMTKLLGDRVKPHLQTIWEASQHALDAHIDKVVSGGTTEKTKVKRAVKGTDLEEKKASIGQKIKGKLESGQKSEVGSMAQSLARIFVEQGIHEREPLIDAVWKFLSDLDPDFTRRETMDAISGYGQFRQLSKDEISVKLRDLKGQMQQVAKLEDMQAGEPPSKTGVEQRIPSKEESRLIKMVNEAKREFQVPITDPNTQLKSSLDTLKKRIETRIDDLNERIATGNFEPKAKRPITLDKEAMRLTSEKLRIEQKFFDARRNAELARRTKLQKGVDFFTKWLRREFVLSSPVSLLKLTSAAAEGIMFEPLKEAAGKAVSKVFPRFSERTQVEGPSSISNEANAIVQVWKRTMSDAAQTLKTGKSDLEMNFGGRRPVPEEMVSYFGRLHAALKTPLKRAAFERVLGKLTEREIRNGVDVTEPLVQLRMGTLAMKEANRMLFLEDNMLVDAYQRFLSRFEQKNKETGKPSTGGVLSAGALRLMLPIVRIPTNLVARTVQAAAGFPVGATKLAIAYAKGIEKLPPEQADLIMRQLKQGSIGAAFMLFGYFNADQFGGYYQTGDNKKKLPVKTGAMKIGDFQIPTYLLHHPLLQVMQLGATIHKVADSKARKSDREARGISEGAFAAMLGLIEETPFVREMFDLHKLKDNPSQYLGAETASILEPQLTQWLAKQSDKNIPFSPFEDARKRKPTNLVEHLEMGIPGLRQNVPAAK